MAVLWFLVGCVVGAVAAMVCAMVGVAVAQSAALAPTPPPDRVDVVWEPRRPDASPAVPGAWRMH